MEIPTSFVEKARFVGVVFTDVENEYDPLLHLLTFGMDSMWRRRLMVRIGFGREMRVLDLACGTGLVTFALSKSMGSQGLVVGLDPSMSMLGPAIRRKRLMHKRPWIEFVRATGEFMPFRDGTFQYETIGLALRNFGDKSAMFGEAHRTLGEPGCFLSIDFVLPKNRFIRRLYEFYIVNVLPAIGLLVSKHWRMTLVYLARSIQLSTPPEEVCHMLSGKGFQLTLCERITLGVVALVGSYK